MTRSAGITVALALAVAGFGATDSARAQDGPYGGTTIELAGHGGVMLFDEGGNQLAYGGRAAVHMSNGLGVGVAVDRANRKYDVEGDSESVETLFWAGEVSYTIPSATRAHFFAFIGAGQARFDPTPAEAEIGVETRDHLLIPLGLGMLWTNHDGKPWWGLRVEFRDNIVHMDAEEVTGADDATTNNYQLSLGLAVLLGAGPQPVD